VAQPFGGVPSRFEPDSGTGKLAVILPGSGYSPAHPLLEFGRQALLQHGWVVQQVWWDQIERGQIEPEDWVVSQAEAVLETAPADVEVLLMGKSLGTMAAGVAASRGLPAVWFTPLLSRPRCVEWHRSATQPALLVGGTADPDWDGALARQLSGDVLEVEGATHFMHVPGDAVRSAEIHVDLVWALDAV